MRVEFDRSTGEVLDDATSAPPKRRRRRRASESMKWITHEDGSRAQVPLTAAEIAVEEAERPARAAVAGKTWMKPGTWRWDVDEAGHRFRRELTPEEIAARDASKVLAEEKRIAMRALLEQLIPAGRLPGEPPVKTDRLFPLDARTSQGTEIVSVVRPNGSKLRLVSRYYDGQARTGRRPLAYVSGHVVFTQPGSHLPFRSTGVMFERVELRAVGQALLDEATRLDALEAAGELPEFLANAPSPSVTPPTTVEDEDDEAAVPERFTFGAPKLSEPRQAARPRTPQLVVTCATLEAANLLGSRLQREGLIASGPYESPTVTIIRLDAPAADALRARLVGEGFEVQS